MSATDDMKDVVYSSRVRLARNIRGLAFPHRLRGEEEIYSVLMQKVKKACDSVTETDFYPVKGTDPMQLQVLVEKHLVSPKLVQECPYGAVLVSKDESLSVMLNEEDHIREQCIVDGMGLEQAYRSVARIDQAIAKELPIAYDDSLGYLTACPTNLGAAMRASAMVFLPALTMTGTIESFIRKYQENGITTRGVYGEGSRAEGDLYQISNQAAIGMSEQEILDRMQLVVTKLVEAERIARQNVAKREGIALKDTIMRAYGTLRYACVLSSQELMERIALVKLGVTLQYIDCDMTKLNQLIVMSQPAMLCKLAGKNLNAQERDVTRAALVKKMIG